MLQLHFQEEIRTAPPFPPANPQGDNFFNIRLTKNIIEHKKDVAFDFRIRYILVLFPFL